MCVHEIVLISFMGYIMKISYSIKYMSTYINWTKNLYETQYMFLHIVKRIEITFFRIHELST